MTDTPETDDLRDKIWKKPEVGRSDFAQMFEHAHKLERERNRYKMACDRYSEDESLCKLQEVTEQRDEAYAALISLRKGYGGQLADYSDDECECTDCEVLRKIDAVLNKYEP